MSAMSGQPNGQCVRHSPYITPSYGKHHGRPDPPICDAGGATVFHHKLS